MRRLLSIPGITLAVFLAWKVALLVFTSQPVPSNDAFFYDGAVVNYLLHGKYCNPALAQVLPISGTEVFSAYPPLYQAVLLAWMKCFGTSALAAMWLHLVLLAAVACLLMLILRALGASWLVTNLAGMFLFGITFHDRPDTLAHVLGMLALLALMRGLMWPVAAFLVLTIATSLQIGGIYSLWAGTIVLGSVWLGRMKFPWGPVLAFVVCIVGLVALVKFRQPLWWAGFLEHVRITPSVTGFRLPLVGDILKVVRTTAGIVVASAGVVWLLRNRPEFRTKLATSPALLVATSGVVVALALVGGCLLVLTPNTIHIAGYLQPLMVGCFLAVAFGGNARMGAKLKLVFGVLVVGAVMVVSVRAMGMTTWGVLCARDVSRAEALQQVNEELDAVADGGKVFVSAAYLYETASRTNLTWIHSDWPAPAVSDRWELHALESLQPKKLLLTQFDYYRRYEVVVAQFRRQRGDVEVRIDNFARVQPPDAIPATQKFVQHISWAPVVVEFDWPTRDLK